MTAALKPVPHPPRPTQPALRSLDSIKPPPAGQITRLPGQSPLARPQSRAVASRSSAVAIAQRAAAPGKNLSTRRAATVRTLPTPQKAPNGVALLLFLQRASTPITLLLVTGALAVYGWTVYIQQRWSDNFHHLNTLERQVRDLTTAKEILNNQIAQEAEAPNTNLVPADAGNTLFLQSPAPLPSPQPGATPVMVKPPVVAVPPGY